MESVYRWIAKHQVASLLINIFVWSFVGVFLLEIGLSKWIMYPAVIIVGAIYSLLVSVAGDVLLKKPLEKLQHQCDPYPFMEEMQEQIHYSGKDAVKQVRTINYALALRNIGQYDQAYMLMSTLNIDKNAAMLPVGKLTYYNNLMDLCFLMGKHQEANIWYAKATQIFHDLKPGKQKERLRHIVEDNRALYHFGNGEYALALQVLGKAQPKDLRDRVENAMMYARTYLAMGEPEKAVKPLQFVAEKGNKLYFATEAKELLAKIKLEET